MVVFVTLQEGARHVDLLLRCYGHQHARRLSEITYHALAQRDEVPAGVYVFCDRERMSEGQRMLAARLWARFQTAEASVRLLNNPLRQLPRYDFLKALHARNLNDYDLWPAHALPDDIRFPVFVRHARDHSGPQTGLLMDRDSLFLALAKMLLLGSRPEDLLVVEHLETADDCGLYRKYGAFRIGDLVFGQHVLMGTDWCVKSENAIATPEALEENSAYIRNDPHARLLMPFFEQAGIEYGRIDYSFSGDRIQVWEINDNPQFVSAHPRPMSREFKVLLYLDALDALGQSLEPCQTVRLDAFDEGVWRCLEPAHGGPGKMALLPNKAIFEPTLVP